jgi:hypothetical protein
VQALFLGGAGERGVDDARFDDGDAVGGVDLQDPVHAEQGEHDAAVRGVRRARQAGAGALRYDGDAQGGRRTHHVLHLFDGAGQHDGRGHAGFAEVGHVAGVGAGHVGVGEYGVLGEAVPEPLDQLAHAHVRKRRTWPQPP